MTIILPSEFEGGESIFTYSGDTTVHSCSSESLFGATVIGWYACVARETKPTTSGYQLSLSYDIHTAETPLPSPASNDEFVGAVTNALRFWREQPVSNAPKKMAYLLAQKYPWGDLQRDGLQGDDATKVYELTGICKSLGFRLGLASVSCHTSEFIPSQYFEDFDSDDQCKRLKPQNKHKSDWYNTEVEVRWGTLLDIEGVMISDWVDVEGGFETIPEHMSGALRRGLYSQKYSVSIIHRVRLTSASWILTGDYTATP